jgi:hypothetical protein
LPEPRRRALAGAGVAEKQMASGFAVDQATAMHLDPKTMMGQIICDQEFIGRIFKRTYRPVSLQRFPAQSDFTSAKVFVYSQAFVGMRTQERAGEIKDEIPILAKQGPQSLGLKDRLLPRLQAALPDNIEADVRRGTFYPESFEAPI